MDCCRKRSGSDWSRGGLKIRTRAERLALGGKQNRPARRILVQGLERIGEMVDQRVVKIVVRRAMDLHRRHMFAAVYFDRYVSYLSIGHQFPLNLNLLTARP